jgi:hypothetical protein
MNLDDINEVWLALETERDKITTLFERLDKIEGKLNGKAKKDKEDDSST